MALDGAGHIIVGGRAYVPGHGTAFALLSIDTSGTILKQRVAKLATETADICQKVLVQPDGKIVCIGLIRDPDNAVMAVVRYLPDYHLDSAFGTGGAAIVAFDSSLAEANSAVLLSTGELILGGFVKRSHDRSLAMARLTASGTLDTTFGVGGRVERPISGTIQDMLQFQGSLFVTGSTQETGKFALLRFSVGGVADTGFGNAGLALADFNGKPDSSMSLAVHQGALLVGGSVTALKPSEGSNIGLARFLPGGTLDTSFSGNGLHEVSLRGPVTARALGAVRQNDGKIVAAGYVGTTTLTHNFAMARYDRDGSLDSAFGQRGIVVTDFADSEDNGMAIAAQSDGRLLVAGDVRVAPATSSDVGVARYTAAGALDTSFGVGGKVNIDVDGNLDVVRAISVQSDGRILLAGNSTFPSHGYERNMAVTRLMADGSRDTSFGSNGVARAAFGDSDEGHALAVQSDGKVLVGGIANADFAIARFLTDGSLDSTFGSSGMVTFDFAGQFDFLHDLLIVPDWKGQGERILAVGGALTTSYVSSQQFAAVLFDLNGNPETGFGSGGMVMVDLVPGQRDVAISAALLGDRLVLAGYSTLDGSTDFALLGLTMDGAADTTFTGDGSASFVNFFTAQSEAHAVVTSPSGEVVLVGFAYYPNQVIAGQMFTLARFADGDRIFRDGFEGL